MEKKEFNYEKSLCENAIMSAYNRGLAEGRNEAWECAKKLRRMEQPELVKIFKDKEKKMRLMGACNVIFTDLTAAETISEIKRYEEKQVEERNCSNCGQPVDYQGRCCLYVEGICKEPYTLWIPKQTERNNNENNKKKS